MNLVEFRKQYPQYDDVNDIKLSKALHQKYYSHVPFEQFAGVVGVDTAVAERPPTPSPVVPKEPPKDIRVEEFDEFDYAASYPLAEPPEEFLPLYKDPPERIKKTRDVLGQTWSNVRGNMMHPETDKPLNEFDLQDLSWVITRNPEQFTENDLLQFRRIDNSVHPLSKELPQKLRWLRDSMFARIPGFVRLTTGEPSTNLRQKLAEEAQDFPGWSGQLGENAADAAWFYLKYMKLLPALVGKAKEIMPALKQLPRVKKVIDTIEKAGGINWLAERFPRTVAGVESALETFGLTLGVAGPINIIEKAWGQKRTLKEAWPEIRNETLLYAGFTTLFDVASSIDRTRYIGQLRKELTRITNVRYKTQGDALQARLEAIHKAKPVGAKRALEEVQIGRGIKSLAEAKTRAYQTIDKLVSDLEAEMM